MKKLIPLIFILLLFKEVSAQDFEYGKYDREAFEMKKYAKDTSAHAVVIREFGKAWVSTQDNIPLVFEYHVKIKIFDSKGFDKGTVAIEVHNDESDNSRDEVDNISGITTYIDENG